jgi:predicted ATPase
VVLLTGEAGIGKSRLTRALQERLRSGPQTLLNYHCSPHYQDSALHPVIAQLMHAAGMERGDRDESKIEKLEVMLGQSGTNLAEDMPLLADCCRSQGDATQRRKSHRSV